MGWLQLVLTFFMIVICKNSQGRSFHKAMNVLPFEREIFYNPENPFTGKDVVILQNLLKRFDKNLVATGLFDEKTDHVLKIFQKHFNLYIDGIFGEKTATMLLQHFLIDKYKGFSKTIGKSIKFVIRLPVYPDRAIETTARLYDANMNLVYIFLARTHGQNDKTGIPLNQLTTNGNTPTGLTLVDLNSPEPILKSFGPYPVVRLVKGLQGNSAIHQVNTTDTFLSEYRNGILIHTGEWEKWKPGFQMPNSNGCIHVPPTHMKELVQILTTELGVEVRKNTFGKKPYPYIPQGLISIENVELP